MAWPAAAFPTLGAAALGLLGATPALGQPPVSDEPSAARVEAGTVAGDGSESPEPSRKAPLILATGGATPQHEDVAWVPPPRERWHDGVAGGVAFGAIWIEGIERGYYGRVEVGAYDIQTRRRGWIAGMLVGIEGWGAPATGDRLHWGGSLPLIIYGGIQSDAAFAVLGGGLDLFLVDRFDESLLVGFFAPQAAANVGVDLEGVRFLLDARASYRWHITAPDRGALRLGGAIHFTTD